MHIKYSWGNGHGYGNGDGNGNGHIVFSYSDGYFTIEYGDKYLDVECTEDGNSDGDGFGYDLEYLGEDLRYGDGESDGYRNPSER